MKKQIIFIAEDSNLNASILNGNLEVKAQRSFSRFKYRKRIYFKLRADDNYKYYNFKFEEKNKKLRFFYYKNNIFK